MRLISVLVLCHLLCSHYLNPLWCIQRCLTFSQPHTCDILSRTALIHALVKPTISKDCGDSIDFGLQIGAFFANTPTCVIGGITTFLFGSIAISGIKVCNQDMPRCLYTLHLVFQTLGQVQRQIALVLLEAIPSHIGRPSCSQNLCRRNEN